MTEKVFTTTLSMAMEIAAWNVRSRVWSKNMGMEFLVKVNDGKETRESIMNWHKHIMNCKSERDQKIADYLRI